MMASGEASRTSFLEVQLKKLSTFPLDFLLEKVCEFLRRPPLGNFRLRRFSETQRLEGILPKTDLSLLPPSRSIAESKVLSETPLYP
jgi:hypothetical protein